MAASEAWRPAGERRPSGRFRLGVFTRLVDDAPPAEVYARALSLFETADALGLDTGWVAQHHAHQSGGLPSPLVFLAAAAVRTRHLRLATGIITLPLESPVRLAEDAAVLDALCGGRLELGFGTGGGEMVFSIFGGEVARRQAAYDHAFSIVRAALAGEALVPNGPVMYPPAEGLATRLWEATFGVEGALRAADHGSGLLLARTAIRPPTTDQEAADARRPLGEAQSPLVDAYLERWAGRWTANGAMPRLGLSRSLYVAPTREEAFADAREGLNRHARMISRRGDPRGEVTVEDLLSRGDIHIGSPEDVIASLRADPLLPLATDLILQVHPVDPSHELTLRSLRLTASAVAPALGWQPAHDGEALGLVTIPLR